MICIAGLVFFFEDPSPEWQGGQRLLRGWAMSYGIYLWYFGDARAGFNLSRPVEYAGDEFIGTRYFITDHTIWRRSATTSLRSH